MQIFFHVKSCNGILNPNIEIRNLKVFLFDTEILIEQALQVPDPFRISLFKIRVF
jgi:hypothetical protein